MVHVSGYVDQRYPKLNPNPFLHAPLAKRHDLIESALMPSGSRCSRSLDTSSRPSRSFSTGFGEVYDYYVLGPTGMVLGLLVSESAG